MPWAIFNRPSIQLSSLQGYLREQNSGAVIETAHPYLSAAKKIGLATYRTISENPWAAEALYCSLLFPERYGKAKKVFRHSLDRTIFDTLPDFDTLAGELDDHLHGWVSGLDLDTCHLVGFTVCFSQLPATLLAIRRLKRNYPRLPVVVGGSTCSPLIGRSLLDVFPEIDYIITGEGEKPLSRLVRYLQGVAQDTGRNVLSRRDKQPPSTEYSSPAQNEEISDLDSLPVPDYEDYFGELARCGLSFIPVLPLEFSRGCWWNKCTFCNLNLQWCGYRPKSGRRVFREVEELAGKYQCLDFAFTDNSLPLKEGNIFFTATAKSPKNILFFGEIRTVTNPDAYHLYHAGGLRSIQVGIEAFSNSLLKRMNKGIKVMDNIAAMKFAHEAGVTLDGNLILEFPGSTRSEVEETCRVLDYVLPFRPLKTATFFLGHGSPVRQNPAEYGLLAVTRHKYNRQLYPGPMLDKLVMLIQSYRGDRQHQQRIWQPVREKVMHWQTFHASRTGNRLPLAYRDGGDFIIIRQESPGKDTLHHRLRGLSRKIYLSCRRPVSIQTLLKDNTSLGEKQLLSFLADLETKRLLFRDGDLCLALAAEEK